MSKIIYRFRIADTPIYEYAVNPDAVDSEDGKNGVMPAWTSLAFHQCPNCTLNGNDHPFCPVAVRLPPLLEIADRLDSYERIVVEVEQRNRRVIQETTAQRALSSLLGLLMATSDCPHTAYLRPMAKFHLPLASEEETEYRAASMYLLAQYFRHREGRAVDMNLDGLARIYQELQRVNMSLADRIRAAGSLDTATNAIVLLDIFAKGVPYSIEDFMAELRYLFAAYLSPPQ